MDFLYVKALHIVFVVCWFAALFYIVRLFIYATEAQSKDEIAKPILTQQLILMQKKLWYIIGWPAMIGTFVFGLWLLFTNITYYITQPWMWLKLISISALTIYHLFCEKIIKQQKQGIFKHSSFKLRLFNEIATVLLVAIVFLVVLKSTSGLIWGILGLFIFVGLLISATYVYRRVRKAEEKKSST